MNVMKLCKTKLIITMAFSLGVHFGLVRADTGQAIQDQTQNYKVADFSSYKQMKNSLLDIIGSAKNRVWLYTDYLTDGEIVTSLYIAKYRKIDVAVVLGPEKVYGYMSRINYLKSHKIPVFLYRGPNDSKTSRVLVDTKLYRIDSDLNFLTKINKIHIYREGQKQLNQFVEMVTKSKSSKISIQKQYRAPVRKSNTVHRANRLSKPRYRYTTPPGADATSTFTYSGKYQPPPEGIPLKLPKVPVFRKSE